ncbi:hypothetical protein L3X38_040273 [Prunus dulcis]|uniref:Uncharacterized protein n=1 Tax=Prunus dulcis TaxID=3755 RepID=A0AAD4V8R6_PRUDU|nr:hypothetical protein L3X38_040273 [Prunus dulcis]
MHSHCNLSISITFDYWFEAIINSAVGYRNTRLEDSNNRESYCQMPPSLPQGSRNFYECYVEHVMYLKMNVVALGKIIINPVRFWCWPTGIESNGLQVNEEAYARERAIQYLKQKLPSTIQYVCL